MEYHHDPEFHYCPVCSHRLDTVDLKASEPSRLVCRSCGFVFYLDPKVVVCAVLEMNARIALLRRSIPPRKGKWGLPGGYVDRGEPLESAVLREIEEECGVRARLKNLLGAYSYPGRRAVVIVYTARPVDGKLMAGDETLEAAWFESDEIPWSSLAFQSTEDALRDYYGEQEDLEAPEAKG